MLPGQAARDRSFHAFLASLRGNWHDTKVLCSLTLHLTLYLQSAGANAPYILAGQACCQPTLSHVLLARNKHACQKLTRTHTRVTV